MSRVCSFCSGVQPGSSLAATESPLRKLLELKEQFVSCARHLAVDAE
jgi:hypothetical protein